MKTCPYCGFENREGVLYCEECGHPFYAQKDAVETTQLSQDVHEGFKGRMTWGTARFEEGAVLVIRIRDVPEPITIEPVKDIVIGRKDPLGGDMPDLDLSPFGAAELGVSRRHAVIRRGEDTLTLVDLESTNGTFLNGQRLLPHQPRVLRDGDEVRMGRFVFNLFFK